MPSTITHAYIGLDTLKELDKKPSIIINKHINNYKIYCQNMDVLYFYHLFFLKENRIQELGHLFHCENVYNYFYQMINDNKKNKDEELFTFIAGLLTHYEADRLIHPYINYLSKNNNRRKTIDKHFEIETYLDNYFTRKYQTENYYKDKNFSFIFNDYTECPIIQKEIDFIFKKYFKFEKMGSYYYKSLKEMCFVYKHVRFDPKGIKKKIYQLIDLNPFNIRRTKYLSYNFKLDKDEYYLNYSKNEWYNPHNSNIKSNKSFLELYNEVINISALTINQIYQYIFEDKDIDLKKIIGNYSYSTGLPLD